MCVVYVGNLDERVKDHLLWEFFLQCGPIHNVHIPKDRVTSSHGGYGFVEFLTEEDAEYAVKIMNQVRLYGKPIRVNKATSDKQKSVDVGAELFIGNLDPAVDEQTLYDTFSAFGMFFSPPRIARNEDGSSKGHGFISFTSFQASDAAVDSMNHQYLANRPISVEYAFKGDGKGGVRHGTKEERLLEENARKRGFAPVGLPQQLPPGFAPLQGSMANFGQQSIPPPMQGPVPLMPAHRYVPNPPPLAPAPGAPLGIPMVGAPPLSAGSAALPPGMIPYSGAPGGIPVGIPPAVGIPVGSVIPPHGIAPYPGRPGGINGSPGLVPPPPPPPPAGFQRR